MQSFMEPIIEVIVVRDIVFQSKLISFAKYLFVCFFFSCVSPQCSVYIFLLHDPSPSFGIGMKGKTIMTVSVKFNFGLQGVSQSLAPFLQTTEPSYFCYDIYLQRSSYSSVFLSSCGKNIIYAEYLAFAFHHSEFFSMRWLISPVSPRNDTLKLSGQLFIYCRSSHSWLMFSKLHYSPKNERRYD